eukprot:COSAG01_NODE_1097_length_11708_cov_5.617743_1_plen_250_part_00
MTTQAWLLAMSISSYASSSSRSDSGSRYNPLSVEMPGDPATDARLRALEMQLRTANRCSCATQALLGAILVVALLALGGGGGGQGGAALSAPGANVTPAGAPHPGGAGIAGGAKPVEEETEGMLSFGEAFFPMYTSNSSAPERVLLLIPEAELQQPFLVSAMRQRAQGFSHSTTMHYPLEQAVFEWARAPGSSGGGGGAGGGQTGAVCSVPAPPSHRRAADTACQIALACCVVHGQCRRAEIGCIARGV